MSQSKEFAKTIHKTILGHIKETNLVGWELASMLWSMKNFTYIKNKKTGEEAHLFTVFADSWSVYVETILGISVGWANQMEGVWHRFYEGEFQGKWPVECRLSTAKMILIGRVSTPNTIASNVEEAFENQTTIEELELEVEKMYKKTKSPKSKLRNIAIHMNSSDYADVLPRWNAFKDKNNFANNVDAFKALLKKAKA